MFLHQQWESYESNRTPVVKRLYWLKRVDNQPFTGAEMKIQGEYAAQMMGLQFYPNASGPTSPGGYDDDSMTIRDKEQSLDASRNSFHITGSSDAYFNETAESGSVLDVSNVSVKEEPEVKQTPCVLCSKKVDPHRMVTVSDHFRSESEPFFPFLQTLASGRGQSHRVCGECWASLEKQWFYFNSKQVPIAQRCYNVEPLKQQQKQRCESPKAEECDSACVCYLCGQQYGRSAMKMLHTRPPPAKNSKHSIYFEFVCDLKRPEHAQPLDQFGRVVTCRACYSYLQRQWQAYQQEGVPVERRRFNLRPLNDSDASFTSASTSFGGEDAPANSSARQLNVQVPATEGAPAQVSAHNERLLALAPDPTDLFYRMYGTRPPMRFPDNPPLPGDRRAEGEDERKSDGSWQEAEEEEIDVGHNNEEVRASSTLHRLTLQLTPVGLDLHFTL